MRPENQLTIAIPVFERYDYFERSLRSALAQSSPCPVLVVDNGSSHTKFEAEAMKYGSRVRYIRQPKNLGMFANWNMCRAEAKTEFLMILGDDDLIHPEFSVNFHRALGREPSLDIYLSDFYYLYEDTGSIQPGDFPMPSGSFYGVDVLAFTAKNGLGLPTISTAMRISTTTPYYSNLTASNDWLALYQNLDTLNVFCDSARLIAYRKHALSDSVKNRARNALGHAAIYHIIANKLAFNSRTEALLAKRYAYDLISWMYARLPASTRLEINEYYAQDLSSPYLKVLDQAGVNLAKQSLKFSLRYYLSTLPRNLHRKLSIKKPILNKSPEWITRANKILLGN